MQKQKNILRNKKIVFLLTNDFTYDERVLKEARSAKNAGMKVTILATKSIVTKLRENKQGLKVIRLNNFLQDIIINIKNTDIKNNKNIKNNLQNKPIIKNIWLSQYLTLINSYLSNKKFIQEVIKIKPDIIHANDSTSLWAAIKLKKMGYKVVYDAHEFYSESLTSPPPFWQKIFVRLEKNINRLDGIFSVCPSIIKELDKRYGTKIIPREILFNAPLYKKYSIKNVNKSNIKIVFIGTTYNKSDLTNIISIVQKYPKLSLTNIGPAWNKSDQKNIINKPFMPYKELLDEINKYDIGLVPYVPTNLNNYYSTPNKLFTYIMAGLAILGTDIVEVRRITRESANGILFKPSSNKDIVKKIKCLIDNPKLIEKYKLNSLAIAKKYCWENQEKKQLKLYETVLIK